MSIPFGRKRGFRARWPSENFKYWPLQIKYYTTGPAPGSIPTEAAQCTVTSSAATKTTVVGADCAANTATLPADGSNC